jgi:hypothetical protein
MTAYTDYLGLACQTKKERKKERKQHCFKYLYKAERYHFVEAIQLTN